MIHKLKPIDLIAIISITLCLVAITFGANGNASSALFIVLGYYFGQKLGGNKE